MKFCARVTCHDSGYPLLPGHKEPVQRGYRRDANYMLTETEIKHLIAIGLFPECFEAELISMSDKKGRVYAVESVEYWNAHIEEWEKAASHRFLPFRNYTGEEAKVFGKLIALPADGGRGLPPDKARLILIQEERELRKNDPERPIETREQELEHEVGELRAKLAEQRTPRRAVVATPSSDSPAGPKPRRAKAVAR